MSDILGIVGSLSSPSKTRTAVELALQAAEEEFGVATDLIHLADYDIIPADGRRIDDYTGDTAEVLRRIIDSRAFIIGTPVYRASYSGVLKNLLDMIPRGIWQADVAPLENSAVGLIATGATLHHYLAIEKELAPALSFFGAYSVGGGVYAHSEQFDGYELVDEGARTRLEVLGRATVELSQAIAQSTYLSSLGPQF